MNAATRLRLLKLFTTNGYRPAIKPLSMQKKYHSVEYNILSFDMVVVKSNAATDDRADNVTRALLTSDETWTKG